MIRTQRCLRPSLTSSGRLAAIRSDTRSPRALRLTLFNITLTEYTPGAPTRAWITKARGERGSMSCAGAVLRFTLAEVVVGASATTAPAATPITTSARARRDADRILSETLNPRGSILAPLVTAYRVS